MSGSDNGCINSTTPSKRCVRSSHTCGPTRNSPRLRPSRWPRTISSR
ncbi:hypothetical protein LEMLEM_LOCUS20928 [Lemmus lemmus]